MGWFHCKLVNLGRVTDGPVRETVSQGYLMHILTLKCTWPDDYLWPTFQLISYAVPTLSHSLSKTPTETSSLQVQPVPQDCHSRRCKADYSSIRRNQACIFLCDFQSLTLCCAPVCPLPCVQAVHVGVAADSKPNAPFGGGDILNLQP